MIVPSLSTDLLHPADVSGPDTNYEVVRLRFLSITFRCWTKIIPWHLPRTRIVEKLLRDGRQRELRLDSRPEGQLIARQRCSRAPQLPRLLVMPHIERHLPVISQRTDPLAQDRRTLLERRDDLVSRQRAAFIDRGRERPCVLPSLDVSRRRVDDQGLIRDLADPSQQHRVSMTDQPAEPGDIYGCSC